MKDKLVLVTGPTSGIGVEGLSDRFFELRKEAPCRFRNRDDEEKLWEICERLVA